MTSAWAFPLPPYAPGVAVAMPAAGWKKMTLEDVFHQQGLLPREIAENLGRHRSAQGLTLPHMRSQIGDRAPER